jgi:hypothetical protein
MSNMTSSRWIVLSNAAPSLEATRADANVFTGYFAYESLRSVRLIHPIQDQAHSLRSVPSAPTTPTEYVADLGLWRVIGMMNAEPSHEPAAITNSHHSIAA